MKKHPILLFFLLVAFLVCSVLAAPNEMAINPKLSKTSDILTVPIHFSNSQSMSGIALFLKITDLRLTSTVEEAFNHSRIKDFSFKVVYDVKDQNVISIGALAIGSSDKPVEAGSGLLATLKFKVTGPNPQVEQTTLKLSDGNVSQMQMVNDKAENMPVEFKFGETEETDGAALPKEFALLGNYPNPFNPTTTIAFALPERAEVSLKIYNITGQLVWNCDREFEAGQHSIIWNSQNKHGETVASGIYFYKLDAGKNSATNKMVLVK